MSQNTSSAVMQQRSEPHDSLDDFPTPPWATRALLEHVILPQLGLTGKLRVKAMTCWEPAANRGYMVRPLAEYFRHVIVSDIHDYTGRQQVHDFLMTYTPGQYLARNGCEWIITNPPFRLAEQFIERAREVNGWQGTAMFVRTSFLEGGERYEKLFSVNPPTLVAQFAERVICTKGIVRDPSKEYWDPDADGGKGKMRRPSTATSYCWLVWMADRDRRPMIWIPPCRRKLEKPGDYVSCETNSVPHRVPETLTESAHERAASGA